jgi:hypothetical protein
MTTSAPMNLRDEGISDGEPHKGTHDGAPSAESSEWALSDAALHRGAATEMSSFFSGSCWVGRD